MCTSPPNKSTHAPSFSVSIGHVAGAEGVGVTGVTGVGVGGDGGHGTLPVDGGFPMTGGRKTGGWTMGPLGGWGL